MANHLNDPITTSLEQDLSKKEEVDEEMVSLQAESIANSLAFPMVLKAALELGVIDTIAAAGSDTWLSPSEIAVRLPTKPANPEAPVLLDRMMRQLASHSILKCRIVETGEHNQTRKIERVYAAEPICKFFLRNSNDSGSFFSLLMLAQSDIVFKVWTHLKNVILEGRDGFSSAHGMKLFEYIGLDEPFGDMFNRAMSESSIMVMKKVLEVYKGFEDANILVDVGGGLGTVLDLVTSKYPHIKGINLDLPHVLAHAHPYPGIKHEAGDMFTEVPKGDVILMKRILHDWTDEDCVKILKNCWKSLQERGKVIIVEMVTPVTSKCDDVSSNIVFDLDMLLLTYCSNGKERSLSEFEVLAYDSGFLRCETICSAYSHSVIEFYK